MPSARKKSARTTSRSSSGTSTIRTVRINRAPVLTLWGAVVAERLGFDRNEALTLGRAVAGLNAQSKGRRLGIFKPTKRTEAKKKRTALAPGEKLTVELLHRAVPSVRTDEGIRAIERARVVVPEAVTRYLEGKFGDDLGAVEAAMRALAKAYTPSELADAAYALYEEFRPTIPAGRKGWGAAGTLDLDYVRSLAD